MISTMVSDHIIVVLLFAADHQLIHMCKNHQYLAMKIAMRTRVNLVERMYIVDNDEAYNCCLRCGFGCIYVCSASEDSIRLGLGGLYCTHIMNLHVLRFF